MTWCAYLLQYLEVHKNHNSSWFCFWVLFSFLIVIFTVINACLEYNFVMNLYWERLQVWYIHDCCSIMECSAQEPYLFLTESCFRHPLFDLRGTRKVETRHTNFHFSSKIVTSKSRKVEVFDLTIVKKLSTFRPKKAKVEK